MGLWEPLAFLSQLPCNLSRAGPGESRAAGGGLCRAVSPSSDIGRHQVGGTCLDAQRQACPLPSLFSGLLPHGRQVTADIA